jgi:IS30 family transposase
MKNYTQLTLVQRKIIGDLEADLMMGKDHKSALITMIEKLNGNSAKEVNLKIKERSSRFSSSYLKTITFDNEKEFSGH